MRFDTHRPGFGAIAMSREYGASFIDVLFIHAIVLDLINRRQRKLFSQYKRSGNPAFCLFNTHHDCMVAVKSNTRHTVYILYILDLHLNRV